MKITLLIVLLISSLLITYVAIINFNDTSTKDKNPVDEENPINKEDTPSIKEDKSTGTTIRVSSEAELLESISNAAKPTIITLDKDITLTGTLFIPSNKDITLTSNNNNNKANFYKLIGENDVTIIVVNNRAVLKIAGIIVTHNTGYSGMGVDVESGGKLVMSGGEISNNIGGNGGVRVNSGGSFEMSGGKISNNNAPYGGGVYVAARGIFSMTGGLITDNTAGFGGGGVWNSGTFTMTGGEITNNVAAGAGGVHNNGTFNVQYGIISGNTSQVDNTINDVYNSSNNRTSTEETSGNNNNSISTENDKSPNEEDKTPPQE